jgi:hypothetical protein
MIAMMMKMTLNIKLVCKMLNCNREATHNNNMFRGRLIAVPMAVSMIDSIQALVW